MKQKIKNKKQKTKNVWSVVGLAAVLLCAAPAFGKAPLEKRLEEVTSLFAEKPGGFEAIFAPGFLKAVPAGKLTPVLQDYFKKGGKVLRTLRVKKTGAHSAEYKVFADKVLFPMKLSVESTPPHKVNSFWIGVPAPRFKSLKQAVKALKKLPGTVSLSAWRLADKQGHKVLATLNSNKPLAIGSTFKLYILGALLSDIAAGKRTWQEVARLSEARRSWPSGVLHKWPAGAPVTAHTLASQMISISDNTATDELLFHLGRQRVEAMLKPMGNRHAGRNKPFLSTREMFRIKETGKGRLAPYLKAKGAGGKLKYLDEVLAKVPYSEALDFGGSVPTAVDKVEWFASADDLCRAMQWLRGASAKDKTARGVLGINRGLQWPDDQWSYVGYKGGSEPGVLNLTWLAKRKDGPWFALSAGWNNPAAALDDDKFVELVQGIILLLEKEGRR